MKSRRILMLYEPGLLAEAVRSLLKTDSRIEIISVVGDLTRADALIREMNPDALVVDGDKFPLRLGDPPHSIRLDCVPLVIALGENENQMLVYRVERRMLTALKELIESLADPTSNRTSADAGAQT